MRRFEHGAVAMNRYERLNAILELVAERGRIDVETLAEELDVSTATIRRDLDHLAQQQFLTRTRGGAVAHSVAYDLPLRYKTARQATEKQRIGKAAADLVTAGMVIGINGGTTTTEVARAIATRTDLRSLAGDRSAVTIVTNARQHRQRADGPPARQDRGDRRRGPAAVVRAGRAAGHHILEGVTLDLAILGVDGIDAVHGASAHHEGEANINQLMASRARQVVVVADSSKIGPRRSRGSGETEDIDLLITDDCAVDEAIQPFEEAGREGHPGLSAAWPCRACAVCRRRLRALVSGHGATRGLGICRGDWSQRPRVGWLPRFRRPPSGTSYVMGTHVCCTMRTVPSGRSR